MESYLPIIWRGASKQARKNKDQLMDIKAKPFKLVGFRELRKNPTAARATLSLIAWDEDYENDPIVDDPRGGDGDYDAGGGSASSTMAALCLEQPCPHLHMSYLANINVKDHPKKVLKIKNWNPWCFDEIDDPYTYSRIRFDISFKVRSSSDNYFTTKRQKQERLSRRLRSEVERRGDS
uniref:Uncharacterized protein n=1 Tax=Tanacetum cinerariifolium TaxID=118510 RepID=A0A6L2NIJ2_TANCI|nr:hypothetical protein [Tanacetum cinerariifolium]